METVGRVWYVEVIEGRGTAQVFYGTRHPATGDQVWDRLDVPSVGYAPTEWMILDVLYAAVLVLMERRT